MAEQDQPAPAPDQYQYPPAYRPQPAQLPSNYQLWLARANARVHDALQAYTSGIPYGPNGEVLSHGRLDEVIRGVGHRATRDVVELSGQLEGHIASAPQRGDAVQHARRLQALGDRAREIAGQRRIFAEPGPVRGADGRLIKTPTADKKYDRLRAQRGARVEITIPRGGPAMLRLGRRVLGISPSKTVWRDVRKLTPTDFILVRHNTPVQLASDRQAGRIRTVAAGLAGILKRNRQSANARLTNTPGAATVRPGPIEGALTHIAQPRTRWHEPSQEGALTHTETAENIMLDVGDKHVIVNPSTPRRQSGRSAGRERGGRQSQQRPGAQQNRALH